MIIYNPFSAFIKTKKKTSDEVFLEIRDYLVFNGSYVKSINRNLGQIAGLLIKPL